MPISKVDRLLQGCGVFDSLAINLSELGLKFLLPERWNFDVVSLDEDTASSDLEAAELDLTVTVDTLSLERMKTHLLELSKLLNQTSGIVSQAYTKINRDSDLAKTLTAGVKDALKEVTDAGFGRELAELLESNRKLLISYEERAEEIRNLRIDKADLQTEIARLENVVTTQTVQLETKSKQISDLENKNSLIKTQAKETETKLKQELTDKKSLNDKLAIKNAALKQDLEDLQAAHKTLLDSLSASEKELQEERTRMIAERTQLNETLSNQETLLAKTDTKLKATEQALQYAQKDNIAYRADFSKLNLKVDELEREVAIKRKEANEAMKTLDVAVKKVARLEESDEKLTAENTLLREELSKCKTRLTSIQAEINELSPRLPRRAPIWLL
jgi:chromosome segregation ATPase